MIKFSSKNSRTDSKTFKRETEGSKRNGTIPFVCVCVCIELLAICRKFFGVNAIQQCVRWVFCEDHGERQEKISKMGEQHSKTTAGKRRIVSIHLSSKKKNNNLTLNWIVKGMPAWAKSINQPYHIWNYFNITWK